MFYSTGVTAVGDKIGGVTAMSNSLQHQKRQLALFISHFLDKGVIQKIMDVDPIVASTGLFLLFTSFFASTRIPTTFPWTTSRVAGYFHMDPALATTQARH